jgi:enoyl-CoA hydratase/carnithine racemase
MLTDPRDVDGKPAFDIDDLQHFTYEQGSYRGTEVDDNVATVTFDRPEKANATNHRTYNEFVDILDYVTKQYIGDDPVEVLIVTGADRWFSAGAELDRGGTEYHFDGEYHDKTEFFQGDEEQMKHYFAGERVEFDMVAKILKMPQIVVGAINGPAMGLGLEVATAPDIKIANREQAIFGVNEALMGLTPLNMGVLRQLMGPSQAKRFMLRGARSFPNYMDAEEARFTGLMDEVVDEDDFDEHVVAVAQDIADMPAEQCRLIKETMNIPIIEDAEETATRQFLLQTVLRGRDFQREQRQKLADNYAGAGGSDE